MKAYDVVVIGGGAGGSAAAKQALRRGATTCIIEKKYFGGVCLNTGCMPTKAMLHAANLCWTARDAFGYFGLDVENITVNGRVYFDRVRQIIHQLRDRVRHGMESREGLDIYRGRGTLLDPHTVEVQTDSERFELRAGSIVIATGAAAGRPGFLPWDSPRLMTSDEAVTAEDLPESILILGGGVIGCEFGAVYSQLGIRTILVEMMDRLLPSLNSRTASAAAREGLEKRGVDIYTGAKLQSLSDEGDHLHAELENGSSFDIEQALISVGRKPILDGLGLDRAGVKTEKSIIPVDAHCRTNVPHIYAVGDVAERQQYAHLAERMGRVAGDNAGGFAMTDDRTLVPAAVYTNPQIAVVGDQQTIEQPPPGVVVLSVAYPDSGTARVYHTLEGQVKISVDKKTGKILAAIWIDPHAVDIIHELVVAIKWGITLEQLYHTIHAHPGFQEIVYELAEQWIIQKLKENPKMPL